MEFANYGQLKEAKILNWDSINETVGILFGAECGYILRYVTNYLNRVRKELSVNDVEVRQAYSNAFDAFCIAPVLMGDDRAV